MLKKKYVRENGFRIGKDKIARSIIDKMARTPYNTSEFNNLKSLLNAATYGTAK